MSSTNNALAGRNIISRTLLSIAIGAACASQAQADDNSVAAVKGAPVVVTATRFDATIDTAPVNVLTITAEDIADSGASNIPEVLRQRASISVRSLFGINGSRSTIDLGGFGENGGSNTLILINGRRLNDLDLASVNLATIPLDSVAQIEIVQGSASVLYGDNAVGGVINIVTKTALDGESGNIGLEFGSFNTRRMSAGLQKMAGDTALSLNVEGLKSDGYRDSNTLENAALSAEISRDVDGWVRGIRYQQSYEAVQLPGALKEDDYKANPTQAGSYPYDATERRYSVEGFVDNEGFAAEIALRNKYQQTSYGSVANLETASFTPRLRRQYGKHQLIAGLDAYRSTLDAASAWSSQYVTQKSEGIYLTDAVALSRLTTLNLGIRRQLIEVRAGNAPAGSDRRNDGITTWDVSLSRKHSYGATNYLRVAESFRAPVLDEMWNYATGGFSLIKPQTARHYEIGTRQTYASGVSMNVNLFRMNLSDEIAYDLASYSNINLDKTRRDGLNIDVRAPIAKKASVRAGYAWRKATYRSGTNNGKDIPLVPDNKFTLGGQYKVTGQSQLGLDIIYTGSRYFANDDANAGKKMDAYTRVDMNYRHNMGAGYVRITLQNLTNTKTADMGLYRSSPSETYYYYPLPERAAYVQLGINL